MLTWLSQFCAFGPDRQNLYNFTYIVSLFISLEASHSAFILCDADKVRKLFARDSTAVAPDRLIIFRKTLILGTVNHHFSIRLATGNSLLSV